MAKGKKAKSPGKGKKGKDGGKAKTASKGSSPGKAPSATPSKTQSSTQLQTTGSSQDITAGSTAALTGGHSGPAAPSPGLFKPLNRPMLPPLVLPADHHLTLTRRPSPIVVWDWGNVWFFPASVLGLALVVVCMIALSLQLQDSELAGEAENSTGVGNVTASNETANTAFTGFILAATSPQDKRTKGTSTQTIGASLSSGEEGLLTTGPTDTAESTTPFSPADETSEAMSTIQAADDSSATHTETTLENSEVSNVDPSP